MDWTPGIECFGLAIRIVSRYFFRPQAVLPAVQIKSRTVAARGSRNDAVTYALVRRFFGNGGLLAVERIGRGIPFPRNITVTIECHQRLGTRLQAEPRHERQITAGGMPDHRDA